MKWVTDGSKPPEGVPVLAAWKAHKLYYPTGWDYSVGQWTGSKWTSPHDDEEDWRYPDAWAELEQPTLSGGNVK